MTDNAGDQIGDASDSTASDPGDIHVIYRLAPDRTSNPRPTWYDQGACLRSFTASVDHARQQGIRCRTTIVVDGGGEPSLEPELGWFDACERVAYRNNSKSFRHVLDLAIASPARNIILAEDDYVWGEEAVGATVDALASTSRIHYASPFAHPAVGGTPRSRIPSGRVVRLTIGDHRWSSTVDTTMTFGVRREVLLDDDYYWWLASYGRSPKDIWCFAAILDGRWFRLVGNAAYRDWRRVATWQTVKIVVDCTKRRLRRSHRPLLVQPEIGLAVHAHGATVPDEPIWRAISARFATLHGFQGESETSSGKIRRGRQR